MNKKLMTALGMGAAYLLKNKESRQKIMNFIQSAVGSAKRTNMKP
ncbi:hypothetical protein [Paenibacillus xerothermodurans]|nr:hypothetical protein [Paenibacillus xerothermodurans]